MYHILKRVLGYFPIATDRCRNWLYFEDRLTKDDSKKQYVIRKTIFAKNFVSDKILR